MRRNRGWRLASPGSEGRARPRACWPMSGDAANSCRACASKGDRRFRDRSRQAGRPALRAAGNGGAGRGSVPSGSKRGGASGGAYAREGVGCGGGPDFRLHMAGRGSGRRRGDGPRVRTRLVMTMPRIVRYEKDSNGQDRPHGALLGFAGLDRHSGASYIRRPSTPGCTLVNSQSARPGIRTGGRSSSIGPNEVARRRGSPPWLRSPAPPKRRTATRGAAPCSPLAVAAMGVIDLPRRCSRTRPSGCVALRAPRAHRGARHQPHVHAARRRAAAGDGVGAAARQAARLRRRALPVRGLGAGQPAQGVRRRGGDGGRRAACSRSA